MDNIYGAPKTVTQTINTGKSGITDTMINNLAIGRRWAKFIAILSLIYAVLMLIYIVAITAFSLSMLSGAYSSGQFIASMLPGLLMTGTIIFISYKIGRILLSYNKAIRELQISHSFNDLAASQEQFRRFTKWISIFITILLVITIIFVAIMFATGMGSMLFLNQMMQP